MAQMSPPSGLYAFVSRLPIKISFLRDLYHSMPAADARTFVPSFSNNNITKE